MQMQTSYKSQYIFRNVIMLHFKSKGIEHRMKNMRGSNYTYRLTSEVRPKVKAKSRHDTNFIVESTTICILKMMGLKHSY